MKHENATKSAAKNAPGHVQERGDLPHRNLAEVHRQRSQCDQSGGGCEEQREFAALAIRRVRGGREVDGDERGRDGPRSGRGHAAAAVRGSRCGSGAPPSIHAARGRGAVVMRLHAGLYAGEGPKRLSRYPHLSSLPLESGSCGVAVAKHRTVAQYARALFWDNKREMGISNA